MSQPVTQNSSMEDKMAATQFWVEATDNEQHFLWEKHHAENDWKNDPIGFGPTLGFIGKKEKKRVVAVSLRWTEIWGVRIGFYYPMSRFVDHNMISDFLKLNSPAVTQLDISNFGEVLRFCKAQQTVN